MQTNLQFQENPPKNVFVKSLNEIISFELDNWMLKMNIKNFFSKEYDENYYCSDAFNQTVSNAKSEKNILCLNQLVSYSKIEILLPKVH